MVSLSTGNRAWSFAYPWISCTMRDCVLEDFADDYSCEIIKICSSLIVGFVFELVLVSPESGNVLLCRISFKISPNYFLCFFSLFFKLVNFAEENWKTIDN